MTNNVNTVVNCVSKLDCYSETIIIKDGFKMEDCIDDNYRAFKASREPLAGDFSQKSFIEVWADILDRQDYFRELDVRSQLICALIIGPEVVMICEEHISSWSVSRDVFGVVKGLIIFSDTSPDTKVIENFIRCVYSHENKQYIYEFELASIQQLKFR